MATVANQQWVDWSQIPRGADEEVASALQLCDRLLEQSGQADGSVEFIDRQLPQIATEFSAQWASVVERAPEWQTVAECGRRAFSRLPTQHLDEVLDRDAGGSVVLEDRASWVLAAVPLSHGGATGRLLLLAGKSLSDGILPLLVAVGRVLGYSLAVVARRERDALRIGRLRSTLEITSSFAQERKSGRLLEVIAQEATRLLDCDRASIFIWDRDSSELVACPALGMQELRIPDDRGLVGKVLQSGAPFRVDDAYSDPRFNREVDKQTGYRTHNLICVPMTDMDGNLVGVFEAMNKSSGAFNSDDEDSLMQLGVHAVTAMRNTREWEQLVRSRDQLTEQFARQVQIIGQSPAIAALRETVKRLAATDLPVLLTGESGTGKEVVAQALHFQGPRANHPFVAVNCAALTETLLESELFGHEKGAFTDAHETRAGKFEMAEGGTLFLDEIGDMSPSGQAKLLRVLEQKVVTRVGGSKPIPINVRIVAATNKNLAEAVREGRFREDLYYRLSVVTQALPPLRERPEDILPLAEFFLRRFCVDANRPSLHFSPDAKRRLQAHSWPGNVRELRNLVERVAFLSPGDRVEADDLAFILSPDQSSALEPSPDRGLSAATQDFQKEFIRRAVKRVGGNMSEAARLLGLHRSNLYRKMRQLGMNEGLVGDG